VHDAAHRFGTLLGEDGEQVIGRGAAMDDERFTEGAGRADVGSETLALPFRPVGMPVVVEAGFADGDHARLRGKRHEARHVRLLDILVFRMQADAGKEPRPGRDQGEDARKILEIDADAKGARHVVCRHGIEDLRQAPGELGKIEVAVRIDQHAHKVWVGRLEFNTPASSASILRRAS
jgi:hypothetical protein